MVPSSSPSPETIELLMVLNHRVTWGLFGALAGVIGSYFAFSRKHTERLAYISGQLVMVLKGLGVIQELKDKTALHAADIEKGKTDTHAAFQKIRDMEAKLKTYMGYQSRS